MTIVGLCKAYSFHVELIAFNGKVQFQVFDLVQYTQKAIEASHSFVSQNPL